MNRQGRIPPWALYPGTVLLIDAIGAAVTSLATAYLLAGERIRTGLPVGLLYTWALLAACFALFDVAALRLPVAPALALRTVACLNLGYGVLVIASLCVHQDSVTGVGFAYFGIEVSILLTLSIWELLLSSRLVSG